MHPDLDLNKISKVDAAVCECHNGVCNWSKHIQQCSVGYKWARAPLTQDEQNNLFLFEGKPVASRIWWEMRIFTKNDIEKIGIGKNGTVFSIRSKLFGDFTDPRLFVNLSIVIVS